MRDTKYELIDTHAHLAFKPFVDEAGAVLDRSIEAGVTGWITVGTDLEENRKSIELAEEYDNLYAAIGFHPHIAKDITEDDLAELEKLAQNEKVVALGEMGLDFHYNFSGQPAQKELFARQLEIAKKLNLPVIIHNREAFEETMRILDECGRGMEKIVFHCFGGNAEQAKVIIDKGWYISFTGVVTFKNAHTAREAAKATPLDRLMLETDCPYMSPEPVRKQKVNEPALMVHTAKFLAELKGVSFSEFADITTRNAKSFFGIRAI
ncbi:MAG: TatD family hydrolase [Sedimentisphaerales bacterium]|nr:TatD family hydrolase [Sedimentisphaerales bacterium]